LEKISFEAIGQNDSYMTFMLHLMKHPKYLSILEEKQKRWNKFFL